MVPREVLYGSEQFREWLVDLKGRALLRDTIEAYAMLRAVLLEIRDRSTVDDALRVADALPPLVRGIMLEGWHPEAPADDPPGFWEAVRARLAPHGDEPAPDILDSVLGLLSLHLLPQDWSDLQRHLPPALREAGRRATSGSSAPDGAPGGGG